jgi:Tfp pilus assembly protein PilF
MTLGLLEQALELDPEHQPSRIGAAAVHEWFGRYDQAAEILSGITRRPDLLFEARLHFAINLYRTGKEQDAAAELERCTHHDAPRWVRVVAYEELVLQQLETGREEQAAALIEDAIKNIPDDQGLVLLQAYFKEIGGNRAAARSILDALAQRTDFMYRMSPRRRYTLWPSEVFELDLRNARDVAHEHLPDLASALASLGS